MIAVQENYVNAKALSEAAFLLIPDNDSDENGNLTPEGKKAWDEYDRCEAIEKEATDQLLSWGIPVIEELSKALPQESRESIQYLISKKHRLTVRKKLSELLAKLDVDDLERTLAAR